MGDIFVIAGQSNSQGYNSSDDPDVIPYYQNGSTDAQLPDAISICTLKITNEDFNFVPTKRGPIRQSFVDFEKIGQNGNNIYPNGADSWCYAELGKDIITATQCPVAFFNAGASGSEIDNWVESIPQNLTTKGLTHFRFSFRTDSNGNRVPCIYDPSNPNFCPDDFFGRFPTIPYVPLRNTLQTFCSMMGVRAILWHQGETDSERRHGNTDFSYYETSFNIVKNRIQSDFKDANNNNQAGLSWFVSKVSFWRSYLNTPNTGWNDKTNANLIYWQGQLGMQGNNHIGAVTDNIGMQSNPTNINDYTRALGNYNVHFSNYGLRLLADSWLASQPWTGNPIIGKPLLPITVTASYANLGTNDYNLSAPAGYAEYIWVISNGLFSNYIGKGRTLNDVRLYGSNQVVMCYVSKSTDPNEMNFFACQPFSIGSFSPSIYPDFLTFDSPYRDFLTTPSPIDQKAYNVINATNAVKNNGTKVNYQAGKSIILENGFNAEKGTTFKAEIITLNEPLPLTWSSVNIGNLGSGTSTTSIGTLSITGYGALGGTSDNIHYYTAYYTSDVNIIARIDGMSSTSGQQAGIMIRNSLSSNATFYEFVIDGNGSVSKIKRRNTGDNAILVGNAVCPASGSWIRIDKIGNTIKCYFKPNDTSNWIPVIGWDDHSDNNISGSYTVGIVAYNSASAIFSNISVNGVPVN